MRYGIVPRDKPGLLMAMMRALASEGAFISLEGDLSNCAFGPEDRPSGEQRPELKRATMWPRQDFVVLPMTAAEVDRILGVILPENRYLEEVIHIQIAVDGEPAFASYDNFHEKCVRVWERVPEELLQQLHSAGVIASWEVLPDPPPQKKRWWWRWGG